VRIEVSGGSYESRNELTEFHKLWEIFLLSGQLLASEEGLCSLKLVISTISWV